MEILEKIGQQVPALAVLVVVVWLFLKASSEQRTEYLKTQGDSRDQWLGTIKEMHLEHLDAREQGRVVLKANAMAMESVAVAIAGRDRARDARLTHEP
jgi:hypothetical protein